MRTHQVILPAFAILCILSLGTVWSNWRGGPTALASANDRVNVWRVNSEKTNRSSMIADDTGLIHSPTPVGSFSCYVATGPATDLQQAVRGMDVYQYRLAVRNGSVLPSESPILTFNDRAVTVERIMPMRWTIIVFGTLWRITADFYQGEWTLLPASNNAPRRYFIAWRPVLNPEFDFITPVSPIPSRQEITGLVPAVVAELVDTNGVAQGFDWFSIHRNSPASIRLDEN